MAVKGRRYARDRRGRFSSTGATARGGRLTTASGKAYATVRTRGPAASMGGTIRPGKRTKPAASASGPASSIRRTGGLKRTPAASQVVSTKQRGKAPMGLKANAIRTYKPVTGRGYEAAMGRYVGKIAGEIKSQRPAIGKVKKQAADLLTKLNRSDTKTWTGRNQKGIKGDMARIVSSQFTGRMIKGARETIQRRAQRAASVAQRGKPAGAKAVGIYDRQLAFTGPGKNKAGKNAIKPGPRNSKPPKQRRKRKGT